MPYKRPRRVKIGWVHLLLICIWKLVELFFFGYKPEKRWYRHFGSKPKRRYYRRSQQFRPMGR